MQYDRVLQEKNMLKTWPTMLSDVYKQTTQFLIWIPLTIVHQGAFVLLLLCVVVVVYRIAVECTQRTRWPAAPHRARLVSVVNVVFLNDKKIMYILLNKVLKKNRKLNLIIFYIPKLPLAKLPENTKGPIKWIHIVSDLVTRGNLKSSVDIRSISCNSFSLASLKRKNWLSW